MAVRSESLRRTLATRFIVIAIAALLLQAGYVVYDYMRNPGDLVETAMEGDLDRLSSAIQSGSGAIAVPADLEERFKAYPNNYGFEIWQFGGNLIASANATVVRNSPPRTFVDGRETIARDTVNGAEKILASRSITINGTQYTIRSAAVGDPAGLQRQVLMTEVLNHVTLPIVPLTVLLFAALWLALDRSLSPIEAAATAVRDVDPAEGGVRLKLNDAPAEIAALGTTVNSLLDRLDDIIKAHHDFAANVAHELRTPLSLIMLDLANANDEASRHALAEAQSMTRLIDQLLAMSRLEGLGKSDFAQVDLAAVARAVTARLAPAALQRGVDLEVVAHDASLVFGQAELVDGALRNLVENAVRVSPPGKTVEIVAGPGSTLAVTDHGPGIAAGELAHLFKRYKQGDRKTQGAAGLGLEISRRTIELHGGRIEVASDLGHGSTFTLVFPQFASDTAPARS